MCVCVSPPPDELHLPVLWQRLEQAKDKEQLNRVAAQIKNQLEQLDNKQVHLPAHPWVSHMLLLHVAFTALLHSPLQAIAKQFDQAVAAIDSALSKR